MLTIKRTGLQEFAPGGKARVRLLVVGGPSSGKTRWASFWPDPIYADCEDGLSSVADRQVPFVSIHNSGDMLAFLAEMKLESAKPDEHRTYRTVVIDTLDAFQRKVKDEWLSRNPGAGTFTGFEAWNFLDAKLGLLLTRLLNLDMNIVVNVHYVNKHVEGSEGTQPGLQLEGGIKDRIFNDFDQVGWLDAEWVAEGGVRVEKRSITFARTPQRPFLKDRLFISPGLKGFPINFEESDYQQLFQKITDRMAALEASQEVGEIETHAETDSFPSTDYVPPSGAGALPAQDPRSAPLEQFDKPTLLRLAREEGVEGVKPNLLKAELIDAIKAHRASAVAPTPVPVPEEAVPKFDFVKAVAPPVESVPKIETPTETVVVATEVPRDVETTPDGTVFDVATGEVVLPSTEEAVASVQKALGGTVISDTQTVERPAPATRVGAGQTCADCQGSLENTSEDSLRLSKVKYAVYLCTTDYLYRKNHAGQKATASV